MNIIVAGGGKVGSNLASLLLAQEHHVKIIEVRRKQIAVLHRDLPPDVVVIGSGTDPTVLAAAGIGQAHAVAAVTGADETNLVIASLARFEFRVPRIIARVNNPRNRWMFTPQMGVDVALNQADLMAHLIAEEVSLGDMMTLLKLNKGDYSLVEEKIAPLSAAAGKAVRDLNLPEACVLAAVIRQGQLVIPRGDTILQVADEVLAVVHSSQLAQLQTILGSREEALSSP